ncbi:uncharacterized protein V6R79_012330 [Siganus canaliculatus]
MLLLNEASDVDSMSLSDGFKRAAVVQQPTHDERLHTSQIQDPDSSAQTMTLAFLSVNHDAEKISVLQQGDLENPAPPGPP